MQSHADDKTTLGDTVFSRDCPEYGVRTPKRETVWVLVNHFKSKGYGAQDTSDRKRWLQAEACAAFSNGSTPRKPPLIAVAGDFNDTPDSAPLAPLLVESGFKDISGASEIFGRRQSGHIRAGIRARQDRLYSAVARTLRARDGRRRLAQGRVGAEQKADMGRLPGNENRRIHAASDHACLYADLDV